MAFIATRTTHDVFHGSGCRNLALRVAKLNRRIDDWTGKEHEAKDEALRFMESFKFPSDSASAYKKAFERWKKAVESRGDAEIFEIEAVTRVLLGTGNASVFEFGFNLSYPWGVPYVSGSSLKGLLSSYMSRHCGPEWRRGVGTPVKSEAQVELFGGVREADERKESFVGTLIFHDAWLAAWPSKEEGRRSTGDWFDADIITPHHFRYYGGNGLPDGTENPVPIKMAVLRPGLVFLVCIQGPSPYRSLARKILLEALEKEGIGGKTAVGYGRFAYVQSEEEKNLQLRGKIEKSDSPAELRAFYKECKNNNALIADLRKALDRIGYSDEAKDMFEAIRPLFVLRKQVEQGDIKDLKSLNQRFKTMKSQIEKALELEDTDALKKTEDGRKLFDLMILKWVEGLRANKDLAVVKNLAYGWEDMDLTADELLSKAKEKGRVWPPLDDIPGYLERHPEKFDADTRDLVLLELGLF